MKEYRVKSIVCCIILFLLIVVTTLIFRIGKQNEGNEDICETQECYQISDLKSYLWVYKSTPQIVIDKVKDYVEENGFSGDGIEFFFMNKYLSSAREKFYRFHVEQYYKGIYCSGYLNVNLDGEIISTKDLKTAAELSEVQTDTTIDSVDAIQIGIDYLGLKENTTDGALDILYYDPERKKLVFIYDVRFNNQDICLYVDGVSGKVLKELSGYHVIKDNEHYYHNYSK